MLTTAFKTKLFDDQYKTGKYYLDLYFSDYRLVIECDENGHADRRPGDEREREREWILLIPRVVGGGDRN